MITVEARGLMEGILGESQIKLDNNGLETVRDVLDSVIDPNTELKRQLKNDNGNYRSYFQVLVNGKKASFDDEIFNNDIIMAVPGHGCDG